MLSFGSDVFLAILSLASEDSTNPAAIFAEIPIV